MRSATRCGHVDVVDWLLEHGVVGNGIIAACERGYLVIAKKLASFGANVHVNNEEPLMNACLRGHYHIVKWLIEEMECDKTILGHAPLMAARRQGYHHLEELLQ